MRKEPHPISGTIYEQLDGGRVRVQKKDSDSYGVFTWQGEWLEGDVTQADPTMLLYIGGPDMLRENEVFWMKAGAGVYDGTTPVEAPPGTHFSEMGRRVAGYKADPGKMTEDGMRSIGFVPGEIFINAERKPEAMPESYRLKGVLPGGPTKISTDRFWTKEFHDLEVERLWKKMWQMACRLDEIPNVGDYHVYDIASLSYLVVRTGENEVQAHQNICLHRGRLLKDCHGKGAKEFRCPYHGWSWNIDGSLRGIPAEWDFPGVAEDVAQLPPVQVAIWNGFVFINPDPDAGSLEEFLGPVAMDHYARSGHGNRYIQARVEKKLRCNWKVAMEAFMEGYHVIATHPHWMLIGGDLANQHFDVFGHFGRGALFSSPGSPQRGIMPPSEEELVASFHAGADRNREDMRKLIGDEVDNLSDMQLQENCFNDIFPNLHPWGMWARNCFRFRPNGDNPEECIMDVWYLAPWMKDKPKPSPAKLRRLDFDDPFPSAPELMIQAKIFEQDVYNLPSVQRGLKAKVPPYIWYSNYLEMKIRNFHRNYNEVMGLVEEPSD